MARMKWFPKEDMVSLDIGELNFAKKARGKKPVKGRDTIPFNLTRRQCVSKVAELFDLTGKITPITATMKLDLHTLVERGLSWDDRIPDDLKPIWNSHFEMMQEIGKVKFKSAVAPEDAVNLNINTIDAADASKRLACTAIYARFLKKDGTYSCQLVFSRSKIVPDGLTQPRAELFTATMNTHTGEIVRRAFQGNHKERVKLCDSQVTLFWINNQDKPVRQWVRNRVVEINRFTQPSEWMFVNSQDMIADLGTRRVNNLELVNQDSTWINGFSWMKKGKRCFPAKTIDEIRLNKEEIVVIQKENLIKYSPEKHEDEHQNAYLATQVENGISCYKNVPQEVEECYKFSNYLIDPNKRRFKTVVRIMALVLKFVKSLRKKGRPLQDLKQVSKVILFTENELKEAENYFFKEATLEVKKFAKPSQYEQISTEAKGILYYNGRILPTDRISAACEITTVIKDLASTTFCVPVIYRHSPLA